MKIKDFKKCSLLDFEYKVENAEDISGNVDFEFDVKKVTNDEKDLEEKNTLEKAGLKISKIKYTSESDELVVYGKSGKKELNIISGYKNDYILRRFIYEMSPLKDIDGFSKNGVDYQKEILENIFDVEKTYNLTGDSMNNFKRLFSYLFKYDSSFDSIKKVFGIIYSNPNHNSYYYKVRNDLLLKKGCYGEFRKVTIYNDINKFALACTIPGNYIYFSTNKLSSVKGFPKKSFNQYRGSGSIGKLEKFKAKGNEAIKFSIEDKFDFSLKILQMYNEQIIPLVTNGACNDFNEFCNKYLLIDSFVCKANEEYKIKSIFEGDPVVYWYGKYNGTKMSKKRYHKAMIKVTELINLRNEKMQQVHNEVGCGK